MLNQAIQVKKEQDFVIISIETDLTISLEVPFEDIYEELTNEGYQIFLLRFHPENHITSGGIAILIGLLSKSRTNGQKIYMTGLSEHFEKTFNMVGITRYTTIYPSFEEAYNSICRK